MDINIGKYDQGSKHPAEKIQAKDVLGKDLSVTEAVNLSKENKGAELLIEKTGADGNKTYDVYKMETNKGTALTTMEIIEHANFDNKVASKFGGEKAIISSKDDDIDKTTFWDIREFSIGEKIKFTAESIAINTASVITSGRPGLPLVLPEIALNERIEMEAEGK